MGIIGIVIGIAILIGVFGIQDEQIETDENRVFHVTLASPEKYENQVYSATFEIGEGVYEFSFVPNGDSPEIMIITLRGESFSFVEKYGLVGTLTETSVSSYYTWDYSGVKQFQILNPQELEIVIDPNGDLLGPVSVDVIRK